MASSFGKVYQKADIVSAKNGIETKIFFNDGSSFSYFESTINPNLHFTSGIYSENKKGKKHRQGIASFTETGEFINMQVWN